MKMPLMLAIAGLAFAGAAKAELPPLCGDGVHDDIPFMAGVPASRPNGARTR